ncbi:hypothetical protein V1525DRAFT_361921 [Lipomyces kononenkoae]|uniref:Uncharacterized protein n=1 Tax=Lipomyces kononenkoae TaxID=34357 RepID=A0ACC3SZ06_LIPKO
MASETALLASRFAVSIAQTRALVASWLESDPKDKGDTRSNGSSNIAGSGRDDLFDEAEGDEEQGAKKGKSRGIGLDKAKQKYERANVPRADDVTMSTEDETSANDEDKEFSKKYTIIVGRGGIGTPASSDTSESVTRPSVSAFRQRKTIEFMQKQIHKRRADNAHLQVNSNSHNSEEVDEDGDEEESRTTAVHVGSNKRPGSTVPTGPPLSTTHPASKDNGNDTSIPTPTKKAKPLSVLDDLIQRKQEQQRRKKKKKKRAGKASSEA